ncbi:MAG: HAD-IA family hydrolase [Dysgonamonadaceae bacterium]|jgi:HAD superfamily hydrolase (TIGR01509 family)|nr:HAD-IA family hydrolase [Dysgonamonadaceae bacterium]
MIKAVLFDMDGVLYDSMPSHVRAWNETMSSLGVNASEEDFYMFEGRTGHSTIDILFNRTFGHGATQEEKKRIYEQKAKRFIELESADPKPMPGAFEVLKKVYAMGLQRVIVTGSGQASLFDKLDLHFPGMFDKNKMVTAYDVQYGKPHPEPYLMGLEKSGVMPDEAVVVENAPLGVMSAVAAGIFTIAVNTGPLKDRILKDAGANIIFSSMTELANNIERCFTRPLR